MDKDTIIDEMIDFVKCIIKDMPPDILKSNQLLSFTTELCESTGVLGKSIAYYQGLKFTVFAPTIANPMGRITFEGSLHKYFNSGKHNYNDFSVSDVLKVLDELSVLFGFRAKDCVIKQLELGVNINPPIPSKLVVRGCYLHGTKRFGWQSTRDKGSYIQVRGSRRTIKIYDKAQQYRNKGDKLPEEILRIEVKFNKMQHLNNLDIFSLSDLVKYGLIRLTNDVLSKEWSRVLYCDDVILYDTKNALKYNNVNYWLNLVENNYELFKYHRNNLNKLYKNAHGIKEVITRLVKFKIDELNLKTTEMHPLYIEYKQGVEDKILDRTGHP